MIYGENQGCEGEACNIWLLAHIDIHDINLWETIEFFKAHMKEKVVECFDTFKLGHAWTKYFWAYYWAKLVHTSITFKYLFSFLVLDVIQVALAWVIYSN